MPETLITGALVDLPRAKIYLNRPAAADTDSDEIITQMINYASGQISKYCARKLLSRTYTAMVHDGDGTGRLVLKEYPVTTVSAIRQRYKDGVSPNRTLDITGLEVERGRVLYGPREGFPYGTQNIEVDYVAGYASPAHDLEIKAIQGACLRWIQVMWQDKTYGIGRGTGMSVGGESISFIDAAIPKDVEMALRPFVRMV